MHTLSHTLAATHYTASQLSSTGMTDRLTTNLRHRTERLTGLSAAANTRRHSCPGHRCFENSSLISWACVCAWVYVCVYVNVVACLII